MQTDAEVAVKLTKAQRTMLTGETRSIGNPERFVLCGDDMDERRTIPTRMVLSRLGLIEHTRFGPNTLSALGLRVAQHLKQENSHG